MLPPQLGSDEYKEMFLGLSPSIASLEQLYEEDTWRQVRDQIMTKEFIPKISDDMTAFVMSDEFGGAAKLAEIMALPAKERKNAVKTLHKKAFGPLGTKSFLAPFEALEIITNAGAEGKQAGADSGAGATNYGTDIAQQS